MAEFSVPSRRPLLLPLLLILSGPLASQDGAESFEPVAVREYHPVAVRDTRLPEAVPHLMDLPEHYPVDPATWRALKEQANRRDAREPDTLVTISSLPTAGPTPLFPGIGFQGLYPPDTHIGRSAQRITSILA